MPLSSRQTTIVRSTPVSMKTYLAATRSAVSSARPCVIRFFNEPWRLFQGPRSTSPSQCAWHGTPRGKGQGAMQHKFPLCCGSCPVQRLRIDSHGCVVCYWLCSSSASRLTLRREDYGRNFNVKHYFYNSSVARSMALALPGSRNIFSTMQHALTNKAKGRIALKKEVHNALDDFWWMHNNIATRPTCIAEIIPLLPAEEGHHNALAGGVWFLGDNITPREGYVRGKPILW